MKKINKIQIFRLVTQIAFLILFPGLITLTFSEIGQVVKTVVSGGSIGAILPGLIELVIVIPFTIIVGRFFCGWFCIMGTIEDIIHKITHNVFKLKVRMNPKADKVLKYVKYGVLAFIVWFMWIQGSKLLDNASPWDALAQVTNIKSALSMYAPGFIILGLSLLGSAFTERFFCRYLCPLGAVFSIISPARVLGISKPTKDCGRCRVCTNNCPMGIELYKKERVRSGECINCFKCTEVCPRNNVKTDVYVGHVNPAIASAVAVTAFVGVYSAGTITSNAAENSINPVKSKEVYAAVQSSSKKQISTAKAAETSNSKKKTVRKKLKKSAAKKTYKTSSNTKTAESSTNKNTAVSKKTVAKAAQSTNKKYKDGTYTGEGEGYRPGLVVSVTVKNDKITAIEIQSDNETPRFSYEPKNTVPQEIIQAQSTKVNAVSGATRTSDGIMMAVDDALSKALISTSSSASN